MPTYVDIGIGVILAIAFIVGLIKGFAKQFTKGLCGFIGFIGAVGLTLIIMPALISAGTLNGFANSAAGWFTGEEFIAPIASQDDLIATLSTSGFLSILTTENISGRIWATMSASDMTTLGQYFGAICARLITGAVIWLVLLLVIKFIFIGIKTGFEKLAELPVLHTLDKIFGVVWSLLNTYVILVVFVITAVEVVTVKFLPADIQDALRNIVENSMLFQVLHDTNVIGAYIARLLNVDLATLAPII